jgi:NTE family protein
MNDTPFIELEDRDFILLEGIHLLKRFGIHETENLSTFISSILTDLVGNKDITFKQLHAVTGKWLTVTYLSLNYGRTIFADHIYEPNSLVREAVIKSCSIPIFYEAYSKKISHNNIRTKTMDVDGGMELNYPMIIPRLQKYTTEEILGFNFYAQASAQANSQDNSNNNLDIGQPGQPEEWQDSPTNIIDFLYNLVQIIRKQAMKVHVDSEDWMSTIKINVGSLTSTQFNLNSMEKAWLLAQGKLAVAEYIKELTHLLESNKYPLRQL